jgi:hypothetical protein
MGAACDRFNNRVQSGSTHLYQYFVLGGNGLRKFLILWGLTEDFDNGSFHRGILP